MKRNVIAITMLSAAVLASSAFAVEQTIDVAARMRVGLSFGTKVDMDFTPSSGHIDFYGTPDPAADFVTMATDGTIAATTSVFQPSASTGTPGSVVIVSDGTSDVFISCNTAATLTETGGKTLTVDSMEIIMNTGVGTPGGAGTYACAGVGVTPLSYTLTGTDKVITGGRLVGAADVITADYSTANSGGTPQTIRVIYQ